MTIRMTGSDCAVIMCNLINIYTVVVCYHHVQNIFIIIRRWYTSPTPIVVVVLYGNGSLQTRRRVEIVPVLTNLKCNGFLPDIILWTQCYLHRGICLNAMKWFSICSLLIPPKRFDIFFPITGGCSEGLGVV